MVIATHSVETSDQNLCLNVERFQGLWAGHYLEITLNKGTFIHRVRKSNLLSGMNKDITFSDQYAQIVRLDGTGIWAGATASILTERGLSNTKQRNIADVVHLSIKDQFLSRRDQFLLATGGLLDEVVIQD